MSAVTIDPGVEACQALIAQINTGTAYALEFVATYCEQLVDPLEEINGLLVNVIIEKSETLIETLAIEDRTSHAIRIWIRDKVSDSTNDTVDALRLLVRQIWQRVNDYTSARVKVWECDNEEMEEPIKASLRRAGMFVTSIVLRAEVEAS